MPEDIHDRILKALLLAPLSVFQLAICLDTSSGAVWDQVTAMWRQGIVEETISPDSRWVAIYLLTDEGSKLAIALIKPSLDLEIAV